jgi:hypothetical protein
VRRTSYLLLILALAGSGNAEPLLGAAGFSAMATGAREAALGGAICALDPESTAIFSNPAGLALVGQAMTFSADAALLPYSQGLSFLGLAGWPQPELAAGVGLLTYGAGDDIEFRSGNSAEPESIVSAQSQALAVGVATHLLPPIWMGLSFKYLSESIGEFQGTAYSSDFGVSYRPYRPLMLAAVFRDYLKPSMDWKEPPTQYIDPSMRVGACWEGGTWRLAADGSSLSGPYKRWGAGAEWDAHPRITLRLGMEGMKPTAGFGSRLRYPGKIDSRIDYAFAPASPSGYLHRFSLVLGLEIMKAEKDRMLFPTEIER